MKLTFEDLVSARYTPHTERNESGPMGDLVLTNANKQDLGASLLTGDFESEDPFVQLMAEVLGDTMLNS